MTEEVRLTLLSPGGGVKLLYLLLLPYSQWVPGSLCTLKLNSSSASSAGLWANSSSSFSSDKLLNTPVSYKTYNNYVDRAKRTHPADML
jgi:hypothetical protein